MPNRQARQQQARSRTHPSPPDRSTRWADSFLGQPTSDFVSGWDEYRRRAAENARRSVGQPQGDGVPREIEIAPPPPVGGTVHPDWQVSPTILDEQRWPTDQDGQPLPQSAVQRSMTPAVPYYIEEDIMRPAFENWSESRIMDLQRQLEQAGLLQRGQFRWGVWEGATIEAWTYILQQANANAMPYDEVVQNFIANPPSIQLPEREEWVQPTYLTPNPEDVGHSVFNMISQLVGDDYATEERVNKFTQLFMEDHRNAWEEQQQLERQQFEHAQTQAMAQISGEEPWVHSPAGIDDTLPEQVESPRDPQISMQQAVTEDLEGIMSAQEEQQLHQRETSTLADVFGSMTHWSRSRG